MPFEVTRLFSADHCGVKIKVEYGDFPVKQL